MRYLENADPFQFVRVFKCGCTWGYHGSERCDLAQEAKEAREEFHMLAEWRKHDLGNVDPLEVLEKAPRLGALNYAVEEHLNSQYAAGEFEDVGYETYHGQPFDWEEHYRREDETRAFYDALRDK